MTLLYRSKTRPDSRAGYIIFNRLQFTYNQIFEASFADLKPTKFCFFLTYCLSTISNKKYILPVFEISVFRVHLRNHLSCKKVIFIYLHPCLKTFQMKKNFWSPVTKSADIFKNAVLTEKSNLLGKIRHFKKFKNFFSWI